MSISEISNNSCNLPLPPEFDLQTYTYELKEERIAQEPSAKRDGSRLLVLDRKTGAMTKAVFRDLGRFLPPNALLIANNTGVFPARLFGQKKSGGKVEFLLLTPFPLLQIEQKNGCNFTCARGLLRASKFPKVGEILDFGENLKIEVLQKHEFGQYELLLFWHGDLAEIFTACGQMPLPPYIRRPQNLEDRSRYQTTFCSRRKNGSVAAPTAGLHFTPELCGSLEAQGFSWAEITLYVGYGTFSPVRTRDIRLHKMHAEYVEIDSKCAEALQKAKAENRPIVAIGTTSARALEGMFGQGQEIRPVSGWTDIFIKPGYRFGIVEHLVTNFHLPQSSLLILVSTLAGREKIETAYRYALENEFMVFSYGDAMLITAS